MAGILSLQFEPVLNDIEKNLEKTAGIVKDFVSKNPDKPLDLVVFPEFFTTGVSHSYVDNPMPPNGGAPIEFAAELAKKYNTNIAAGTVVIKKCDGKLYNTMFVLDRTGETVAKYDKIHLFKYFGGTENERITPGNKPVVAELDFGKAGLSICFDIKYPLHHRKLVHMGAEFIINPSAWAFLKVVNGQKEQNTRIFKALSIARANENLVYFITSNQCGNAGMLGNTGYSMIVSPNAEILANAKEEECAIYADIDLGLVRQLKITTPMSFEE